MVGQSKLAWMDNMNSYQGFISDGSTPDSVLKLYASTKIICKNTRYMYVRLFPLLPPSRAAHMNFPAIFFCILKKVWKILTLFCEKITLRGTCFHRAQMHQKWINTLPIGPWHTLPSQTSPLSMWQLWLSVERGKGRKVWAQPPAVPGTGKEFCAEMPGNPCLFGPREVWEATSSTVLTQGHTLSAPVSFTWPSLLCQ